MTVTEAKTSHQHYLQVDHVQRQHLNTAPSPHFRGTISTVQNANGIVSDAASALCVNTQKSSLPTQPARPHIPWEPAKRFEVPVHSSLCSQETHAAAKTVTRDNIETSTSLETSFNSIYGVLSHAAPSDIEKNNTMTSIPEELFKREMAGKQALHHNVWLLQRELTNVSTNSSYTIFIVLAL